MVGEIGLFQEFKPNLVELFISFQMVCKLLELGKQNRSYKVSVYSIKVCFP